MVLTITMVNNGQNNGANGHVVANDLAQLMHGQTVTGLLNPDGTITLNSNVMSAPQLTSLPTSIHNGTSPITSSAGSNYQTLISTASTNSITNIQAIAGDSNTTANSHSIQNAAPQKKAGQKRLSAKQKLAQQQQQQQQQKIQQSQSSDTRSMMATQPDQSVNQQPQIVATVQLPNGQIGQLIAPSGGQFWSPNAINLQQLSMAVAAATGGIPQTMSMPPRSSTQPGPQIGATAVQQQSQSMQPSGQLQQGAQQQQSLTSANQLQQVVNSVQQPGQVISRQGQNQIWSGGQISLSQLSALAQQGVVQLSPVQGIPSNGPNGQRVMEMIPQAAIQGLLNQNGQPIQAIPLSSGGQLIAQDPSDPNKWQIVSSSQLSSNQQSSMQSSSTNTNGSIDTTPVAVPRSSGDYGQFVNPGQNTVSNDSAQSTQTQRKLKRLACTCPNCRDGDNSRSNGDKKKQHICHFPDCNKVYGKTSHLRAHLRWHSGERPYVCGWSFCGKKFTRSDELQRHRRTHTGEKRFQCSECLKRFMRSDHLSKHLKTHLSSKKSNTNQQQANCLSGLVNLPQVKLEEDMIDELDLGSQAEANRRQSTNHQTTRLDVNNQSS